MTIKAIKLAAKAGAPSRYVSEYLSEYQNDLNGLTRYVNVPQNGARKEPMRIVDLARQEQIPPKFLELILLGLKNQGILQSRKGKGGGYLLARDPADIYLGQIVRMFDGPLAPVPCASQTAYVPCADCPSEAICGVHLAMKEVRDATARVLDGTSLASLRRQSSSPATQPALPDSNCTPSRQHPWQSYCLFTRSTRWGI